MCNCACWYHRDMKMYKLNSQSKSSMFDDGICFSPNNIINKKTTVPYPFIHGTSTRYFFPLFPNIFVSTQYCVDVLLLDANYYNLHYCVCKNEGIHKIIFTTYLNNSSSDQGERKRRHEREKNDDRPYLRRWARHFYFNSILPTNNAE